MRKMNIFAAGIALGMTLGILNIVCLILLLIAPQFTMSMFGSFMHGIDLNSISIVPLITIATLEGIIVTVLGGFLIGVIFATLYNKFTNNRRT